MAKLNWKDICKYVILLGVIPMVLVGGALYAQARWSHEPQYWFEVAALYFSVLAMYFAERASRKSEASERQSRASEKQLMEFGERLVEYGLSSLENRAKFEEIFQDHLLVPLTRYRDKGGRIYLLLSTPAYGYAVVGASRFQDFVSSIAKLHEKCELEVVFFSPDDHFDYWANVLVWSEIRAREKTENQRFAEDFADCIIKMRDDLKVFPDGHARFAYWVTRSTTVREFAFLPLKEEATDGKRQAAGCVYVVLTDLFSISQDQYQAGFRARSIRIPSSQQYEYIDREESYFERAKVCPYTGKTGKDMVGDADLNGQLWNLHADYLLGRTRQMVMGPGSFASEIEVFLKQALAHPESKGVSEAEMLFCVLKRTLSYFDAVFAKIQVQAIISREQARRLTQALLMCRKVTTDDEQFNQLIQKLLSFLSKFAKAETEINPATAAEPQLTENSSPGGESHRIEQLIACLYAVLSSGFGESEYATVVLGHPVIH